ncbi:MAG: hypothetical protein EBY29_03315 [Planctomycetes bacterium]|jgi:hypothetical protein|nr:hypothetical protein [Planctomycetota bacterium]
MAESGLELIISQLNAQIEKVKDCMVVQALEHPEYLRLRGLIQGLEYAKEIIKDLAKRMENDTDE